jgi:hypothetical protein
MGGSKPSSLDFVARPAGGDQVFLMVYSKIEEDVDGSIAVTGSS